MKYLLLITILLVITGCATNPPKNTHDNICQIYKHDRSWEKAAKASAKKWGTPEYILMAFVHQESRFVHDAKPKRRFALGFIPLGRKSSAVGFAQALDGTWDDYRKATGNRFAKRTNIRDALDFIGWYNYRSFRRNGISRNDAFRLYLAYHEGHGGFSRGTYRAKPWLISVARKVERRANKYRQQLKNCSRYKPLRTTSPRTNNTIDNNKNNPCQAPWPFC